ncbi:MAG: acetyl-CoA carboxylase carboxyltransferase subunit alpha [Acidobacteria bacterium]|nr:acetyl-CoA carboxylase carboxyltransferase subunit alpha [Acidobacteriota bacterium]
MMRKAAGEFEIPLIEMEEEISHLKGVPPSPDVLEKIEKLEKKLQKKREDIFSRLSPWQRVEMARHPDRPYTMDFIDFLFEDFIEIHGDRRFSDDPAIITGFAFFHGLPVCVIGHEKGRTLKEKVYRNFGMPQPEGYRKALRVMKIAEKFNRPILTFVDTPGAYPGIGAEERGQAEAIAYNLREMAKLEVPVIVTVTGEGGSGGALGIAVGEVVNIMEHAVYSVITPEGCASILWRDPSKKDLAAEAMKMTASDLKEQGLVSDIIPEPPGGAHIDYEASAKIIDQFLQAALTSLSDLTPQQRIDLRYQRFRNMGFYR